MVCIIHIEAECFIQQDKHTPTDAVLDALMKHN